MKKILLVVLLSSMLFFTGCEKVTETKGDYKEGTYYASVADTYGGGSNTAIAVIHVDENGVLKSVYLDATYTKDGVVTTKKALGDDYNMMANPSAAGEWYEQVEKLEAAVVEKQGLDGITLNEDGKTDAVSGCTIQIDTLYRALQSALEQAK